MSSDLLAMLNSLDDTPVIRENYIRSPFGYPGSKARSLDNLLPLLPYRDAYCEPFGGSGAALLSRRPSKLEIFNDRYAGVTVFYRCVRDPVKCRALVERLELCIHSREEFIWCKETWKNCEDEVERAARWYYMTLMSFSQKGQCFGRALKGRAQQGPKLHNNLRLFHDVHLRMREVQVENLDWRECFRDFDSPDMVWYLDPTYYDCTRGMYEHEMSKDEHIELCERAHHLRGFVALSGYDNPIYNRYKWDDKRSWTVHVSMLGMSFTETNNLAGMEDVLKRGSAQEVVWIREAR